MLTQRLKFHMICHVIREVNDRMSEGKIYKLYAHAQNGALYMLCHYIQ